MSPFNLGESGSYFESWLEDKCGKLQEYKYEAIKAKRDDGGESVDESEVDGSEEWGLMGGGEEVAGLRARDAQKKKKPGRGGPEGIRGDPAFVWAITGKFKKHQRKCIDKEIVRVVGIPGHTKCHAV